MVKRYTKKKGSSKPVRKTRVSKSKLERHTDLHGEGVKEWLKKSHLISNIGQFALPAAGAALGGLAGSFAMPGVGTVEGGTVGAITGSTVNDLIRSAGYGKAVPGKPLIRKREQFATGKKGGVEGKHGGSIVRSGVIGGSIARSGTIRGGAIKRAGRGKHGEGFVDFAKTATKYAPGGYSGMLYAAERKLKKGKKGGAIRRAGDKCGSGYTTHGRVHKRTEFAT
jgi:hypothetical protein